MKKEICENCGHSSLHHGIRFSPKGKGSPEASVKCVVKHCKCKEYLPSNEDTKK